MHVMLGGMGYDVDYAVNGNEAIDLVHNAAELKKPFLAIIMDLTIPGGMGGREAIEKIRETEKDLPAFVSSGYSDGPVLAHPADYKFTDRIGKPFIKAELANLFSRHFGDKSSAVDTALK
ncbi:MAG: response regulator [Chitinispirillaceae bacterium]|nr:response regulator [Chitinispirillaceae bacterium]